MESADPEFARRLHELMSRGKHLTMATLRRDRSSRISGTEVEFADGELSIGSMAGAVKAADLRRDPRIAIHGPTRDPPEGNSAGWSGEAKISGIAVEVEPDHFRIDVREAVITRLNEAGTRLVIESWTTGRGYRVTERD